MTDMASLLRGYSLTSGKVNLQEPSLDVERWWRPFPCPVPGYFIDYYGHVTWGLPTDADFRYLPQSIIVEFDGYGVQIEGEWYSVREALWDCFQVARERDEIWVSTKNRKSINERLVKR